MLAGIYNQHTDMYGCISEIKCNHCGQIYRCDSSGKAGQTIDDVTYINGPCACGYSCPKCYPNGLFHYHTKPYMIHTFYVIYDTGDQTYLGHRHNWTKKLNHAYFFESLESAKEELANYTTCGLFKITAVKLEIEN